MMWNENTQGNHYPQKTLPLSRFIVASYRVLIEIALWLFLLIALIAGASRGYGFGAHLGSAIISLIVAFIIEIIVFGIALVILDIQTNVRIMREKLESNN